MVGVLDNTIILYSIYHCIIMMYLYHYLYYEMSSQDDNTLNIVHDSLVVGCVVVLRTVLQNICTLREHI